MVVVPAPDGDPGRAGCRVGTLAEVQGVRPLGPQASLLRLGGRSLVRLGRAWREHGRWWTDATRLAEPGPGARALLEGVELSLRRYLAWRGEAGEGGPTVARLSPDPVTASHEVASVLRISWPEVQEILEAGSAADRLRRAQAVLDREAELLRRLLGREGT